MRSRRIRPLDLSSSYFTLEPNGISITQSNSWGSLSPGVTSCQGWIIRESQFTEDLFYRRCRDGAEEKQGSARRRRVATMVTLMA